MKKLLLLFVFIAFSAHLYPSWIKTADYDFFRTGVNIQSLAVTGDSRFAYTSDDSGRVIKWDLETGDSISMFKATPLAGLMRNNKWCFISSDAKTFSCSYYNIKYNDWYHYIFIYDIDSGILVDSLSASHLNDFAVPEVIELTIVTVDYNSAANKLFYGLNVTRRQDYMYKDQHNEGMINCLVKENDKWRTIFYSPRSLRSFDNNFDSGIAFLDTYDSFSTRLVPHGDQYTFRFTKISYLANSVTGNMQIINNFAYEDGKRAGTDYDITSCIIIDSILLNNNKNLLFKYNTNDISLLKANTLKEYPNTYIYLARSFNKDYFFILDGNRLNIHDFSSFIRKRIIEVDPADRINIVRNTPDSSKIILTDYRGGLYRIYSDSIFRLYANFNTNDTIYTVADTIQFEDLSIGKPDVYSWDFGDGQTSAESNPKHNYSDTGVYTVRLVIGKGAKTDTIIKTNYITVIPKLDVTFSYMVNVDYPTKILYTNTTIGDYDSLLWVFHDKTVSKNNTASMQYYIHGNYPVTLNLYKRTVTYSKTTMIPVQVNEPKIYDTNLIFEYPDTNFINYEAIKGFDDKDNNLIFHLKGTGSYFGMNKSNQPVWSVWDGTLNSYLFKRQDEIFTYANYNYILNFDKTGKIFDKNSDIDSLDISSITCPEKKLAVLENKNINRAYQYKLYDLNNKYIGYDFLRLHYFEQKTVTQIVKVYEKFPITYRYFYFEVYGDRIITGYTCALNGISGIDFKAKDLIALNDSMYVLNNDNEINVIWQSYTIKDNKPSFNYLFVHSSIKLQFFKIQNIQKLTDSLYVVAGDSSLHPGYIILNTDCQIRNQKIYKERFGSFNFAYQSANKNLLFSGWIYHEYNSKTPYYLKTLEPLADMINPDEPPDTVVVPPEKPKDSSKIKFEKIVETNILKNYCYPNPGKGEYVLIIEAKGSRIADLNIYDYLGNNIFKLLQINLKAGHNELRFNISSKPIGLYIYRLTTSDDIISGNIIKLKD